MEFAGAIRGGRARGSCADSGSRGSRITPVWIRFLLLKSSSGFDTAHPSAPIYWGASGDIPVPGLYDPDQQTDIAVWRPSNGHWYILRSTWGYSPSQAIVAWWGEGNQTPVGAFRE